jgi:hypothetical protein
MKQVWMVAIKGLPDSKIVKCKKKEAAFLDCASADLEPGQVTWRRWSSRRGASTLNRNGERRDLPRWDELKALVVQVFDYVTSRC